MIIKGFFPFGFDYDDGVEGNNSSIDPNQKFFVLGKFQDWFFTSSLVVCILGTFFSGITAVVFLTKEHKQSKDIYACALSTVDVMCNLSGVLFTLNQLSKWGYTKCACRVTIYLWRLTPTLSWLLILSIAISRYLAVVKYDYFRRNFTKKKAIVNIVIVFIFSSILCVPFIFTCNEVKEENYDALKGATRPLIGDYVYTASLNTGDTDFYAAMYRIALVFFTSVALVILYGRIVYELGKRKKQSRKLHKELRRVSEAPVVGLAARAQNMPPELRSHCSPSFDIATATQEQIEHFKEQLERLTWFFTGAKEYVKNHLSTTFGFTEDSDAQTEVMFINVFLLFGLTNIPYSLVETINSLSGAPNPNPRGESMLLLLFVIGFNLNPFIFYSVNVWFRKTINNTFRKVFCCR